jgi:hypothetical protein
MMRQLAEVISVKNWIALYNVSFPTSLASYTVSNIPARPRAYNSTFEERVLSRKSCCHLHCFNPVFAVFTEHWSGRDHRARVGPRSCPVVGAALYSRRQGIPGEMGRSRKWWRGKAIYGCSLHLSIRFPSLLLPMRGQNNVTVCPAPSSSISDQRFYGRAVGDAQRLAQDEKRTTCASRVRLGI